MASRLVPAEIRPHLIALYAFARARAKPVLCLAHVTNRMAVDAGDFEKGEADGSSASLSVIMAAASAWRRLAERDAGSD